ncbi:MAG: sulfite exporter TauE/SafE family protein [Hyphomicrobiales bacterium]|nr:sulfite exporter TauE/SafE family protein [Hyphomicrobiales bacterium]
MYLPIAEQSLNLYFVLGMGAGVGFLSGMFGVGGGFLMTPLLIFSGIPAAVAVATEANQIVASSVSGSIAQWRRGNVDVKMGLVLLAGGVVGSVFGVQLVKILREIGQVDLIISLSYVVFLGIIGSLMLVESLRALRKAQTGQAAPMRRPGQHNWIHGLPFKLRFHRSKLYISAIPPLAIGAFVGLLAAIMGVGGGFIMVPAMIYLLRVPTNVVVGTSLFQIVFVTSLVTILHATQNQTVDAVLALLLMAGGVIGAQFGARAGHKLKGEQLRALLALMVLAVCLKLAFDLVVEPANPYSLSFIAGGH